MSVPDLPVTIDIKTVTAIRNGELGLAEPYLMTVFFAVDGGTMKIVQRADGKLALSGTPVVRRTDSRHGNLPEVRDGETVAVPDKVGRNSFALKPIPLPGELGEALVGGASGVVGVLYVLAEEDAVSDAAILAGYDALVDQFTVELRTIVAGVLVDPAAPGANPLEVSSAVEEAITERIKARVKGAVLANSNLVQKLLLVDKDDIVGTDVLTFTETELLADRSRPFSRLFDVGSRGEWRIAGSADATLPPDFTRRRRVTFDLGKLTCVSAGEGGLAGGDEPYMWNVFLTVDGSTVILRDNLRLSGQAAVVNTRGSHGNLGLGSVGPGQTVEIPDAAGRVSVVLDLIRFPADLAGALVGGVSGVAGCVSVLLEQDLFAGVDPDDVVGFNVFLFTHKQMLAQPQMAIAATFGQAGRYDLVGSVTAAPA